MLQYKATLPLSGLAVPLFALFASVLFELSLQLTALLQLSVSLGVSITLPTIAVAVSLVAVLVAQFQIAATLGLPSFALNFAAAIDFELVLVLGFLATLDALINAIASASLIAYGWLGSAQALGASLTAELASAWPDGTTSDATCAAVLFVATSSGPPSKDSIASLSLAPVPSPAPTPTTPPPPPNSYPPPQAYEHGLASLVISPPAPGGIPATGFVTLDNSVATGIGAVTSVTLLEGGSGYTSPPTVTISDTVSIVSASNTTPVVLTLPNALTIPAGLGLALTVAGVTPTTLNGQWCAEVLTPTTVALYVDPAFTQPVPGAGPYSGGTATGSGSGAVALATMGGGSQNALQSFLDGLSWPTSTGLAGGVITFVAMLATVWQLMLDLKGNLQARANLLGGVKIGIDVAPPTIDASISLLLSISANLKANLNVALPDLTASLSAALSAQIIPITSLVARIGLFLGLGAIDLEVWEYSGPGSGLGAAISAGPGGAGWHDGTPGTSTVTVAVFGLTNSASATAFAAFFPGA